MSDDETEGLDALFGETRVNHGGPNRPPVIWKCDSFAPLSLVVSSSSSTSLMAHHVWQSSLTLANLLARQEIPGIHIDVSSAIIELGSGAALPSLVCDSVLHARVVVATDYPDAAVLAAMQFNVDSNKCSRVCVRGFDWANQEQAITLRNEFGPFDYILAADTLWMPQYHEILLEAIVGLMNSRSRLVLAFLHHDYDKQVALKFISRLETYCVLKSHTTHNWREEKDRHKSHNKEEYGDVQVMVFGLIE